MSDSLQKLIRLSSRHKLPVIVHDAVSGESAVLMNLDEYEVLSELREECEDMCGPCDEEEDFDEEFEHDNEDFDLTDEKMTEPLDFDEEVTPTRKKIENTENEGKQGKFSGSFQGKENFPLWNESGATEEVTPPWADPQFAVFQEEKMKMAHELHRDKLDIDWDKAETEEVKYEPSYQNAMFPAFSPVEDDESGEEPIFFEEPV